MYLSINCAGYFTKGKKMTTVILVSSDANGVIGNASSMPMSISANGRYVVFDSDATNLVAGDTNEMSDVFVKDTQTGEIIRVSTDATGAQANSFSLGLNSGYGGISADGRYVT